MDRIEGIIEGLFPDAVKVGGEYAGPCPDCGGKDRFRIFPGQGNQGIFRTYCRQCGRSEDALQMAMEVRMTTWLGAHEYLGIPVPGHDHAKAGFEIANDRPLTPDERRRLEWSLAHDAQEQDTTHRLSETLREKGPDDVYFKAALYILEKRLAGCLVFLAQVYRDSPRYYEKMARVVESDGFPDFSFDVLGIDQQALDEAKMELAKTDQVN